MNDDVTRAVEQHDYAAAERMLRAELAASPNDDAARFMLARVLGWSKDYDGAIAEYDALIHAHPDDVDYVFGKAQVLGWSRRDAEALAELERARALAPAYEDVWRLELTVLERSDEGQPRLAAFRDEAGRRFPDQLWWREPVRSGDRPVEPSTELTAGTVHESLSRNVPDWERVFVQVDRRRDAGTLHAGLSRDERFGAADLTIDGGADWKLSARWSAGVALGFGPDADFMPRTAASAWALRSLPRGWETELRLGHRSYTDARVTAAGLGFGRYFGDFRAAYRIDLSELDGATTSGAQSATLSYYRSPRTQFNLSLVAGQEAESVGPATVLRTDVTGFTAGGRHGLGERLGLSWWLGSQRQGNLYRRKYVGLSVSARL